MFKRELTILVLFVMLASLVGNVWAAPPPPDDLGGAQAEAAAPSAVPCPYPDQYEDDSGLSSRDDWAEYASTLTTAGQPGHSFDIYADKDWAKFEAQAGYLYIIATTNLNPPFSPDGQFTDTVLELYEEGAQSPLKYNDDYGGGYESRIAWVAPKSGTYYVKVYNDNSAFYGCEATYDLTLTREGTMQISKTAEDLNGAPLLAGDVIRYTIVVTNGSVAIQHTNVVITDPIPAGTTFVPGSASTTQGMVLLTTPVLEVRAGTMDPGAVVTVRFSVRVNPGTSGQEIVNQAWVRSDQLAATGTPPVAPPGGGTVDAGLQIDKTALDVNGTPLLPGDVIRYTIVVTNASASTTHTNVIVTDYLPDGVTYIAGSATITPGTLNLPTLQFLLGTLSPGAVVTLSLDVQVNEGVTQVGPNRASVRSDQQDEVTTGGVYPFPGTGRVGDALAIYKAAEDLNGGPLYAGDEIEYTIAVVNLLTTTQTNVRITDDIPAGTTYLAGSASATQGAVSGPDPLVVDVGTLAGSARVVVKYRVTVNEDTADQTIQNTAQASSDQQANPVSNVPPAEPQPYGGRVYPGRQALGIRKTAEDLDGGPLYVGDLISYTIEVVNLLTTTQENVVITDALPAHTNYILGSASVSQGSISGPDPLVANVGALAPGQKATLVFRVSVAEGAVGNVITNTAQAASDDQAPPVATPPVQPYPDPIPGDPTSGGGWVLPGEQQIGINKKAEDLNGAPLKPGDVIEYTVVIWNEVDDVQTSVVITDYIPAYTTYVAGSAQTTLGIISGPDPLRVNVGDLQIAERVTFVFRVQVNEDAVGQKIANRAWASSDQQQPPAYTPPVTTPGGGIVSGEVDYIIYLPLVVRNAAFN